MGLRMLVIRRELGSFAERTRDRWGDALRNWRTRSEQTGSLRDQLSFQLDRFRDWRADIRAEGGLWVRNGRPRVLTHALATAITISATASITWVVATDGVSRSGTASGAQATGRTYRSDTPKPIRAVSMPARSSAPTVR